MAVTGSTTVGVLALQGAFAEHVKHLKAAAKGAAKQRPGRVDVVEVRTAEELARCDALVIPGGESTAISLIAARTGLLDPLRKFVRIDRKPVWGTCAGMILLADEATKTQRGAQDLVGGLDVRVHRNHFGRQTESFSAPLEMPFLGAPTTYGDADTFEGVFIRAPVVECLLAGDVPPATGEMVAAPTAAELATLVGAAETTRPPVEVLCSLERADRGERVIVAVRQGSVFGTSFHPELTADTRLHEWWLRECVLGH
ncbi:pyridoxal biosynthesis protein PDX2 [Dipodascopsis tothii]|uniref:pyridoxal biosynthesis protein PDX2 n=1 Tax=Dipodascopsis tothii TaxID=44089 RepID=UPI0034CDED89